MGQSSTATRVRHAAVFLPIITDTFADLGYRRATTAILAQRCGVQENILYRVWPNKKAMFLAAISFIYERTASAWQDVIRASQDRTAVESILDHQADHQGESGMYRIIFAGLNETDDTEIRAALRDMYRRFHRLLADEVATHRADGATNGSGDGAFQSAEDTAWALMGLATLSDIARSLNMRTQAQRATTLHKVGQLLINGGATPDSGDSHP